MQVSHGVKAHINRKGISALLSHVVYDHNLHERAALEKYCMCFKLILTYLSS